MLNTMNRTDDYPRSYRSDKIPHKVSVCRSPIELKYFRELDNDPDVISYIPEPFKIPYSFENKHLNYIPDVLIHYTNGINKLVEVKVMNEVSLPKNIAKFHAAKEYAKNNGMIFKIIVRRAPASCSNLPVEGEYDDHISAKKSEGRWLYKRILPPAIIVLVLFVIILFNGGIGDAMGFIFGIVLILLSFLKVFGRAW